MPPKIGKYHLECELGRGGMGVVWLAHDEQLQRHVAIKLMHALDAKSAGLFAQFQREAQAVARLQSPYVVQVYDFGITDEGQPYMVMELLEGESLASRLRRTKTMTPAALLPILTQIAKSLDAAHAAGIIHRDIKPGNIFLAYSGTEVLPKLLDFGIAVMRSDSAVQTPVHRVAGTPAYMSPEQIHAESLDGRADLWSLAVIIYEALTGRVPFKDDDLSNLLMRICMDSFAPPSSIVQGLNSELDAFFTRALAKSPDDRFLSAHELVTAFARAVPQEVPTATTILVVDDEPDLALLMEQCFQDQIDEGQYRFLFAGNGSEGLSLLREHPDVDIVLTDLRMPVMDGLTLLSKLGQAAPAARAVVISAYSDMRNIRQAMNSGAFDFLIKPIDFADLEITIEKAAREVRHLRQSLQHMEENQLLRMFVNPAVREQLLPILRVSGATTGERIEATVAVIRIQGQDASDPLRAVEYINHAYDILMPMLEAHDGEVARFLGDAVLVVFRGEAHRQRAVAACFVIRGRLGPAMANTGFMALPRIGVSSGLVTTGSVGTPSKHRFEYAIFGEPVQIACELEQRAQTRQILVDESLGQSVESRFRCEPAGDTEPGSVRRAWVVVEAIPIHAVNSSPEMYLAHTVAME